MNMKQESKVALVTTDSPGHERTFKLMWMDEGGWSVELTRMECQRLGECMVEAAEGGMVEGDKE